MKKITTLLLLVLCGAKVFSQHYETLSVTQMQPDQIFHYCISDDLLGVIIYGEPDCNPDWQEWEVNYQYLYGDSIVLYNDGAYHNYEIYFNGCESYFGFTVILDKFSGEENPFETPILWKRFGDTITLSVGEWSYHYFIHGITCTWSNEEQGYETTVAESGPYSITLKGACDSATYSIQVRDNVEIESASVDPESNKNLVTWKVIPAQAEYISNVIINRDGVDLVTVPYINGQYLDNIGSDLAARIYTVTGVSVEGTPCPIPSFERGTIHMAFLPDINGNVEMTWNSPELGGANIHVGRYEICEYDPNGKGGITVIDFVGPSTMSYSCNQSMFDYGYPLIRAIIQDGRGEKDMLSNRTEEIVGLDEKENKFFNLYPNPTTGRVTIEGTGHLTITNVLGQTLLTRDITDTEIIDLPSGVWFVKLNETTRKVVVE